MKECIICGTPQELSEFYVHTNMADGHLNKCKLCCRNQAKAREVILRESSSFVEAERERGREKYYRLGYKGRYTPDPEDKHLSEKKYKGKYPEKYFAKMAISNLPKRDGYHQHHWSYKDEHWRDVIELSRADHYLLHRNMIYDTTEKLYRDATGMLLSSKESHVKLLETLR